MNSDSTNIVKYSEKDLISWSGDNICQCSITTCKSVQNILQGKYILYRRLRVII